jgi:hypothetical protein
VEPKDVRVAGDGGEGARDGAARPGERQLCVDALAVGVILPLINGGVMSMGRFSATFFPRFVWLGLAVPARHRVLVTSGFAQE